MGFLGMIIDFLKSCFIFFYFIFFLQEAFEPSFELIGRPLELCVCVWVEMDNGREGIGWVVRF